MSVAITVLLVAATDDDARLVLHQLELGGYVPIWEQVGDAAAMDAALDRQAWDLIIADFAMPRFGIATALALVQRRGLDVPLILVSGAIAEDVAIAMLRAGVHGHLLTHGAPPRLPAMRRESRTGEALRQQAKTALHRSEAAHAELIGALQVAIGLRDDFLARAAGALRPPLPSFQRLVERLIRGRATDPWLPPSLPDPDYDTLVHLACQLRGQMDWINERLGMCQMAESHPHFDSYGIAPFA